MDVIYSLEKMKETARLIWKDLKEHRVIAFHGEMGAGKTTLIHALCDQLEVVDAVGSPTFALINEYATFRGETIYHIDLYRITNEDEATRAGVEDCLYSPNRCWVEWPENAPGLLPPGTVHIYISALEGNMRKLEINL